MSRKKVTTKEDIITVIDILENAEITYWIDGGWGVDILAGKQEIIEILILILIPDIQKNCCIFFLNTDMK